MINLHTKHFQNIPNLYIAYTKVLRGPGAGTRRDMRVRF